VGVPKIVSQNEKGARFPSAAKKRREILFEAAGVSLEDEAALLKSAIEQNKENLKAEKIEVFVNDKGDVTTVRVPDNQVRQRAVESIFDLVGAKPSIRSEGGGDGPSLTLVLPDYYSKEFLSNERGTIDVTPKPVQLEDSSDGGDGPDVRRDVSGDTVLPLPPDGLAQEGYEGAEHILPSTNV